MQQLFKPFFASLFLIITFKVLTATGAVEAARFRLLQVSAPQASVGRHCGLPLGGSFCKVGAARRAQPPSD